MSLFELIRSFFFVAILWSVFGRVEAEKQEVGGRRCAKRNFSQESIGAL